MDSQSTNQIISLLNSNTFYTQQELSVLVGVSKSRVNQILKKNNITNKRPKPILDFGYCKKCNKPFTSLHKRDVCRNCNKVLLICSICNISFPLTISEYNKRKRIRTKDLQDVWFCTKKCYGKFLGQKYGQYNLRQYAIKRTD